MGTAGALWIPPRIDLASFPQPDVSSCRSGEQQGRLSPCCGGVSRTPCFGQAHFPGSNGWDMSLSVPHFAGAAGLGTSHPLHPSSRLACSPVRSSLPFLLAPSCCHGRKEVPGPALCSPSPAMQRRAAPRCSHFPQALRRETTRPCGLSHSPLCQAGFNLPLPAAMLGQLSWPPPAHAAARFLTELSALFNISKHNTALLRTRGN